MSSSPDHDASSAPGDPPVPPIAPDNPTDVQPPQTDNLLRLDDPVPSTVYRLPVEINERILQQSIGDLRDILGLLTAYQLQTEAYRDLQQEYDDLQRDHALLRREITTLRVELTSALQQAAPYVTFCQHRYDLLRHRLEDTQLRLAETESALADRRDDSIEIACLRDRLLAFQRLHADVVAEHERQVDELEARLTATGSTVNTSQLAQAFFDQDVAAAERDAVVADRDSAIASRAAALTERDSAIGDRDSAIAARDAAVVERDFALGERDAAIVDRDSAIRDRYAAIISRDSAIRDRDSAIADRNTAIVDRDQALGDRDTANATRDAAIADRDKAVAAHAAVREECDVLMKEIQARTTSLKDAENSVRLLRRQIADLAKEISGLHDQLSRQNTSSRRVLDISLAARDDLQAKLDQANTDLLTKQTALFHALQAQQRTQRDLGQLRAQANVQRARIASLEGQVGSSHQRELDIRRLETENTALAKDLEVEKRKRAVATDDRDRALLGQADAEADRDRLIAERHTVQTQLSSLGSIFGVPVQATPPPPSSTTGRPPRSQSVPGRQQHPSASHKKRRRASSGTLRPKRTRAGPPATRGASSRGKAESGSASGGTPSSPIILSGEEDADDQPDSGTGKNEDNEKASPEALQSCKGHGSRGNRENRDDREDRADHEDLDTHDDHGDQDGHDDHKGPDTHDDHEDPDILKDHEDPVPPARPSSGRGRTLQRSSGGRPDPDGGPSDGSSDESVRSSDDHSGNSANSDGNSSSSSSHASDNTLLAAQEYDNLLPTVISRRTWIPGYRRPIVYRHPRDCAPWPLQDVSRLSIRRLRLNALTAQWTCPKFWLFPRNPRAPSLTNWHPELITEANIRALYAVNPPPWDAMRRLVVPRSFELNGWFADFCRLYESFEDAHRQVFWETTHKLPITPAMCTAEPFLGQYREDCRVRRMRAGPRWKRLLGHLMEGLKNGECDLDLLLDPYFLHFPARGEQVHWYPGQRERRCPADLLAALQTVDRADPWRNQYRADIADHPGSQLARLDRKFFQADDSD